MGTTPEAAAKHRPYHIERAVAKRAEHARLLAERRCDVCGDVYQPKGVHSRLCGKRACRYQGEQGRLARLRYGRLADPSLWAQFPPTLGALWHLTMTQAEWAEANRHILEMDMDRSLRVEAAARG